ncbi:4'-phosphopantetheinyl transferase family protein [Streptomyces sp. NPDC021080]|uniref:4'-phosphopantetheinyl transferase family protein n=1 Tax=Streptomyces sp. NPDC021080 TaxID=3365110 RepID=UPI0037B9EBF8
MSPVRPEPPPGEVHVWTVPEPGPGQEAALWDCLALLSPDELRRQRRMVPSQRALYASAHAALRSLTAAYTGLPASRVAFLKGAFGKPYVSGFPGLRVSLAHTEGMSLIAVSRDGPTGVDVERVRPLRDPAGLRRQVLCDLEAAAWPADHEGPLNSGLFTHWACKEAVLKALGSGLAGDLTAVHVAPGARREGPVRVLAAPGSPSRVWNLHLVDLGTGFRAAVAVAGGGALVRVFGLAPGTRPRLPGPERPLVRMLPPGSPVRERAAVAAPDARAPAARTGPVSLRRLPRPAGAGSRLVRADSRPVGADSRFSRADPRGAGAEPEGAGVEPGGAATAPGAPDPDRHAPSMSLRRLPGSPGPAPPSRAVSPAAAPVPVPAAVQVPVMSSSGRLPARHLKEVPPCSG